MPFCTMAGDLSGQGRHILMPEYEGSVSTGFTLQEHILTSCVSTNDGFYNVQGFVRLKRKMEQLQDPEMVQSLW